VHLETLNHQRIVERPRLIRILDSLAMPITLISAPAGYGKSTLVRQWAATRRVLWYTASAAAQDVAELTVSLHRACGTPEPEIDAVRAYVASLADPDIHVREIAEHLARTITRSSPETVALVIDEYDAISAALGADRFVEAFTQSTELRTIIIGRRRPSWATARRLLYGEIGEISRDALAFTSREAQVILESLPRNAARLVWTQSRGWPAVLRLAAMAQSTAVPTDVSGVSLHAYFAKELYDRASASLQRGLLLAALLPTLGQDTLARVWGDDVLTATEEAVRLGFFFELARGEYELHPLLRDFLLTKVEQQVPVDVCERLLDGLLDDRDWDSAYSVIRQRALFKSLPRLVEAALDDLLDHGRVRSLEDWSQVGREAGLDHPVFWLVEAELSRRAGNLGLAESQALHAAASYERMSHGFASRAYALAGVSAYLTWRPADARRHQESARRTAQTAEDQRRAVYGEILVSHVDSSESLPRLVKEYEKLVGLDPRHQVKAATAHLLLASLEGSLEDAVAEQARWIPIGQMLSDPMVASAYFHVLGYAHLLLARYDDALTIAREADKTIKETRLSFARTHVDAARVAATIGLRRLRHATQLLDELEDLVRSSGDSYERDNVAGLRARLRLLEGDCEAAAAEVKHWSGAPATALRGELAAVRAIALACAGHDSEARALGTAALATSRDVQAQTMGYAALAILALQNEQPDQSTAIATLTSVLRSRGNWDSFVLAYRAYPPLLRAVSESPGGHVDRLATIVKGANDTRLSIAIGLKEPDAPALSLTRREREVFELLCEGLTNGEIAARLYISHATAKVHVKHILEKLDVRSRTEAVSRYYDA
jgi:LuxR family maltose regulon positive regulatory protein